MTTQEVADKLIEYCRTGRYDLAYQELYAENAVSIEMPGAGFTPRAEGMAAIKEKGEKWNGMVEEFHGTEIEGPLVSGEHFSCIFKMDITMKGAPRTKDEEIALYQVKEGKIVSEQFFYPVKQQ